MGFGINPTLISKALEVRKFLKKNPIDILAIHHEIVESKDGTGYVAQFQFKFAKTPEGKKQAEIFMKMHELAEEMDITKI